MFTSNLHLVDGAVLVFVLLLLKRLVPSGPKLRLPPGPRGLPLFGNAFDLPTSTPYKTYIKWGRTYGPLTFVWLFQRPILVVNSAEAAFELLDRRWKNYSDRPSRPMQKWIGNSNSLGGLPYGPDAQQLRRLIMSVAGKPGIEKNTPTVVTEVHRFMRRLLDPTMNISDNIKLSTGSTILDLNYGYDVLSMKDEVFQLLLDGVNVLLMTVVEKPTFAEFFPKFGDIATYIPGDHSYKIAAKVRDTIRGIDAKPLTFVKNQLANGSARPSFVGQYLSVPGISPEKEAQIRISSISMFFAGYETTASGIHNAILAMSLYPEIQARAQEEIDRVVGTERLPTLQDRSQLPYLVAMVKEAVRWSPPTPECPVHMAKEADEYMGYHIPKGTSVVVNLKGICHDPQEYPNPYKFDPTRFLGDKPERDPTTFVFGFGRRVCPGRPFAEASIFLYLSALISTFNIVKDKDSAPLDREDISKLPWYPAALPCHAELRSESSRNFVNSVLFRGEA